jgi:excisionase family DNA binding protein
MLACVEAGWRINELADELELKRTAAQARVQTARDRGITTVGLDVPAAPRRRPTRADQLALPVDEREWLTATEAAELAGVGKSTIPRWLRLGLLPHTQYADRPRPLYLRADVLRVMAAPRASNGGIDPEAALERIRSRPGRSGAATG